MILKQNSSIILLILKKYFTKTKSNRYIAENRFKECPPLYPNAWFPVLQSKDLKKCQIKPFFGFGNDLVVFRGVSGKVYNLDAYCPHLGANLGVGGTVVGEDIKCPFHGWNFNNLGKCMAVPGIEGNIRYIARN